VSYIETLKTNNIQIKIEELLEQYKSQPVGTGYIDIIVNMKLIKGLISELANIGVAINGVTWWCHCLDDHEPHGLGGPSSIYYNGWFSEMGVEYESLDLDDELYEKLETREVTRDQIEAINNSIILYVTEFTKNELFYECMYPAIWLHVPKEWKRKKYLVEEH